MAKHIRALNQSYFSGLFCKISSHPRPGRHRSTQLNSAFHRQFKAETAITPLEYQEQRLLEARRLMTAGAANVEDAASRVGYQSSSQFNREYGRMFGLPPRRDINQLKRLAA